jgi:hypothetical protein
MRGAEILASYLPATIVSYLLDCGPLPVAGLQPRRQEFETVVLFADISGFTKLSEAMNLKYKDRGMATAFLCFPPSFCPLSLLFLPHPQLTTMDF